MCDTCRAQEAAHGCPVCQAAPGERCRDPHGRIKPCSHASRDGRKSGSGRYGRRTRRTPTGTGWPTAAFSQNRQEER
jgi:hypothetical protein